MTSGEDEKVFTFFTHMHEESGFNGGTFSRGKKEFDMI